MEELLKKLKNKNGKLLTTDEYAICENKRRCLAREVEEISFKSGDDYLLLKFGTLKSWNFKNNKKCQKLFDEYQSLGISGSVMAQSDGEKQKEIICKMIDNLCGVIQNDWSGEYMTKKEAKDYINK